MRDLGVGERHPRHEITYASRIARQQRVANGLKSLPASVMGELIAARDVARGVDVFHISSKAIIHLDAIRRIPRSRFVQLQSGDVWFTTNGDEQQVTFHLLSVTYDEDHVSMESG